MNLVTLVTSTFDLNAIQHIRNYKQPITQQSATFPYYLYLEDTHWSWSTNLYDDRNYTLVPLQAILQPQNYPEYYI